MVWLMSSSVLSRQNKLLLVQEVLSVGLLRSGPPEVSQPGSAELLGPISSPRAEDGPMAGRRAGLRWRAQIRRVNVSKRARRSPDRMLDLGLC